MILPFLAPLLLATGAIHAPADAAVFPEAVHGKQATDALLSKAALGLGAAREAKALEASKAQWERQCREGRRLQAYLMTRVPSQGPSAGLAKWLEGQAVEAPGEGGAKQAAPCGPDR